MTLSILILINLVWTFYSVTEGSREGFYWHYENLSKRVCDFDVNKIYNIQRFVVWNLFMILLYFILGGVSLFISLCLFLQFSYFHNGTYYYTRNKLGGRVYDKGWKDESKTFPPFTPLMKYSKRTSALIIGIISQIFIYLYLLN